MKNIFKIILVLFFFFNIFNSEAQKVKDTSDNSAYLLKSEKPKFQITFPTNYKLEDSKTEKGLKTMFYRAVKNDDVYMFKFTEHKNPAVSPDNQVYMNASLESFVTGIHAELIKKFEFKEKKEKGLEAFLKIPDTQMNVFYRVLIVKHVQYQLIVITKAEEKTEEIINYFKSFHI
ncbi:MAG: hypothetical protein J7K64_05000 [Bacteroidales bacterium]|nr:hypothetical protein [Bacteroidales bacterium]